LISEEGEMMKSEEKLMDKKRRKKVVLEFSPWIADRLDFMQRMTGESYTCICRTAVNEYLSRALSAYECDAVHSIESVRDKDLLLALKNWEYLDQKLKNMPASQVNLFKKVSWELLRLLKQKKRFITISEASDSFGIEYPLEIAPFLMDFFDSQESLFSHRDIIPDDDAGSTQKNDAYYEKRWRDYGNILKKQKELYEKNKSMELAKLER
jgi:hypothetical protein